MTSPVVSATASGDRMAIGLGDGTVVLREGGEAREIHVGPLVARLGLGTESLMLGVDQDIQRRDWRTGEVIDSWRVEKGFLDAVAMSPLGPLASYRPQQADPHRPSDEMELGAGRVVRLDNGEMIFGPVTGPAQLATDHGVTVVAGGGGIGYVGEGGYEPRFNCQENPRVVTGHAATLAVSGPDGLEIFGPGRFVLPVRARCLGLSGNWLVYGTVRDVGVVDVTVEDDHPLAEVDVAPLWVGVRDGRVVMVAEETHPTTVAALTAG